MTNKGFTLVEVLVTAFITSIVLTGMSIALTIGTRSSNVAIMNSRLTTNGNLFVKRIVADVLENAELKVEDITSFAVVVGEKMTIKDKNNNEAVVYELYYSIADASLKNKIYRTEKGSTKQEIKMFPPANQTIELEKPATGYVLNSLNGYQADILLTLVCKQDNTEVGRKVIKTAGITCRNYQKS